MAVIAVCVTAAVLTGNARAQAPPAVSYAQYDVELTLADNGDLSVRVRQRVEFGREYHNAFLDIPKDYTNGIEIVGVYQVDEDGISPVDFTVTDRPDTVAVAWTFPPTRAGDTREFVIDYVAKGALWVYNERDILRWDAVHAAPRGLPSGVPVEASQVSVRLPSYVPLDAVRSEALGAEHVVQTSDDVVVFRTLQPLEQGQFFNVQVEFPHGLVNSAVHDWQKEADSELLEFEIPRVETRLWINPDGTLTVREEIDVRILESVMYGGFRDIPRLYLDNVADLRVFQDGSELVQSSPPCEECRWLTDTPRLNDWVRYIKGTDSVVIDETRAGSIRADWESLPVYAGDTARLVVEYDVIGAVKPGEQSQSFTWQAVPDYGVPVAEASIRIHPPPTISAGELVITSTQPTAPQRTAQDGSVFVKSQDKFAADSSWLVYVTLPRAATSAASPLWLTDMNNALADAKAAQITAARRGSLLGAAALALLAFLTTALLASAVFSWFKWGRKRVREKLGGYISEPPSALAPGLTAYLVDGGIGPRSVLASMIQLGSMGLAKISLQPEFTIAPLHSEMSFPRRRENDRLGISSFRIRGRGNDETLNRHLAVLYNDILLPTASADRACTVSDLKPVLSEKLPEYFAAMAADARAYGLAPRQTSILSKVSPALLMTSWFLIMAAIVFLSLQFRIPSVVLIPLVLVIFVLFFWLHASRQLRNGARPSPLGDAERQRWLKFRNYLLDIKKYGDQAAARRIMDEYFAYAVALGVEELVLDQAARQSLQSPRWIANSERNRTSAIQATPGKNTQIATTPPQFPKALPVPNRRSSLARLTRPGRASKNMSRRLGNSLAVASAELGSVLSMAAADPSDARITVKIRGRTGDTDLSWDSGTPLDQIGNEILRKSARGTKRVTQQASLHRGKMPDEVIRRPRRSTGGFGRRMTGTKPSGFRRTSKRRSGGGGRSGFG